MKKGFWERVRDVRWGGVLIEDGALSQGRLMGWILFGLMIFLWLNSVTVPESLFLSWMATLTYNAGKKLTNPFRIYMETRKKSATEPEPEQTKPQITEIDALGGD